MKQVNLKSRGSARRCEIISEKRDHSSDVTNGTNGLSTLAGKYALYRPRPGKNAGTAIAATQSRTDGDDEILGINKDQQVIGDSATCRPASERTSIYESIDKARINSVSVGGYSLLWT